MMKLLIIGLAGATAVSATAQTTVLDGGMNAPNYSTFRSSIESTNAAPSSETPTMRAAKLERAKALKAEATLLLQQDGGTFTPQHVAYIRGKACDILGYSHRETGSLVARRRCV
ncbi:hypothetical protein U1872_15315 [Sphingomonas sp. RB3P16]|uniref:hypothetical protein n=1 Tax=Parasphingomonas frigoris TaxID=3096163 RepID=UPI002FCAB157